MVSSKCFAPVFRFLFSLQDTKTRTGSKKEKKEKRKKKEKIKNVKKEYDEEKKATSNNGKRKKSHGWIFLSAMNVNNVDAVELLQHVYYRLCFLALCQEIGGSRASRAKLTITGGFPCT